MKSLLLSRIFAATYHIQQRFNLTMETRSKETFVAAMKLKIQEAFKSEHFLKLLSIKIGRSGRLEYGII